MRRVVCLAIGLALLAMSGIVPARAQTPTTTVFGNYVAGWNMVGAPAGTDLSAGVDFWAYGPGGYFKPTTSIAQACTGLWVQFVTPVAIPLNPLAVGPTQACPLQNGWNLLGNPFAGNAVLPSSVTAYYWNPSRKAYDIVTVIPPGGAVWVFSNGGGTINLVYQSTIVPPAQTLVLSNVLPGPFTLHVGDSVKLQLPAALPYIATVGASSPLVLDSAGLQGPLSCLGDPTCSLDLLNRFWIWHAVKAGVAYIDVTCGPPATTTCTRGTIEIDVAP